MCKRTLTAYPQMGHNCVPFYTAVHVPSVGARKPIVKVAIAAFADPVLSPDASLMLTLYNIFPVIYPRGQHDESYQRASGTSRGAQSGAVANRQTRSSYFGDRVIERFGNITKCAPTKANHIGSFTAKNGTGPESSMGEGWEGNTARRRGKNEFVGCEAHNVSISPQKDCSRSKSEMGKVTRGTKESCVK
jgi:hypothetical protein